MKKKTSQKTWVSLAPGDIVDVVAPASACSQDELKSAIEYLKELDLVPRIPKDLFDPSEPLLSNSDKYRYAHLKSALFAKDSKVIWCLRGGYGSLRLLPEISRLSRPKAQKLFIGLSDIASLHIFFTQKWGWHTVHGPMLGKLKTRTRQEQDEINDLVFGRKDQIEFSNLIPLNEPARKKKLINGHVLGGNLMTIQGAHRGA
jgi:muramoyltetrapeptide carboxypeptidase